MDDSEQPSGPNPMLIGGLVGCGVTAVLGLIGFLFLVVVMSRATAERAHQQAELAQLDALLERREAESDQNRKRLEYMMQELRSTRELVVGDGDREVKPEHYRLAALEPANQLLREVHGAHGGLKKALDERGARAELRELDRLQGADLQSLVDVFMAYEALGKITLALAQPAGPSAVDVKRELQQELAAARERYQLEVNDLRTRLSKTEDEVLEFARANDIARRSFDEASAALEQIVQSKRSTEESRELAKRALEVLKPR